MRIFLKKKKKKVFPWWRGEKNLFESKLMCAFLSFYNQRPEDQRLIYSGKLLLDHQCLQDLLPKVFVALSSCFGVGSGACV